MFPPHGLRRGRDDAGRVGGEAEPVGEEQILRVNDDLCSEGEARDPLTGGAEGVGDVAEVVDGVEVVRHPRLIDEPGIVGSGPVPGVVLGDELQPGLLEELPVAKRLRLLRFILKGCAGRPARLRGIANHVVCISPSLQSEAEAQFDSLQSRIKSEWLLASLFDPKKHQEDLLATLSLVENEIRFEQSRN